MNSAHRERQDKTYRYGGDLWSSNQQPSKRQQYENHAGDQFSPFKKFAGLKKTPGKKTIIQLSSSDSVVDSIYALGSNENQYSNSQETNLSTTEASFTKFLLKQQQPQKQFNYSEAKNLNSQQASRKQRQAGSVYANPQIIQKNITEIPYVSYRPYQQQQQLSQPTVRHNSVYASPLVIANKHSNENKSHALPPQQKLSQHQQIQFLNGLQHVQHHQQHEDHHCARQYGPSQCQNQNQFELGRNQSAGSLLTFNGYADSPDDNLTLLNNSTNSRDSNETEDNPDNNNNNSNGLHHNKSLLIEPQKTSFSQFQLHQHDELLPPSSRNKRNHSMYTPSSNFNLEKQVYLPHSNNNLVAPQISPLYQNKSSRSCGYSHAQYNSYFDLKTQPQQQIASRSCSPNTQQYSQCLNQLSNQHQQIPTSPFRAAYVQSSSASKNPSPIHTPSKNVNHYSPNLYEIIRPNMISNNNQFPPTNKTGLFGQHVTGSTVLQQSCSMCHSSVLQSNSLFKNNIPPSQECQSSKSSNSLQTGCGFGSIKQDKSGFLNTQSSFINGLIHQQGPSQTGIFRKCPQLQQIIDDLKDHIVKDLENLSHKLQTESEAILLNQINLPFQQQYRQQQQEQVGDLDLGEYSLGEDKKVRFSFSGREVIAQISATNNGFNNKIYKLKENILSTFATPMFQTSSLSPMQQQIIASEIIANLPYDRLPNTASLSPPRNPLESGASYLPTFSSPQKEIILIRQREAFVSQETVETTEMRMQEDKLFEQFFKSQNEEEKKDEENEQRVNSFEEEQYGQCSNKNIDTAESQLALGKVTPEFESSNANLSHKNSLDYSEKLLIETELSAHSPALQSSASLNKGNTHIIEGYHNEVQSIAQNMPNAVSKTEHLFSDHDDVVLRTDNTDQMSESSPKLTRLWDSKVILKSIIPLQLISGRTTCGFTNPITTELPLDDIKEQYEIESANTTPKTQPIKNASEKILQIKTSLAEIKEQQLQEDSSNITSINIDVCPSYRGSTKSNSSQSSSSGACRRYQDFSTLVQQSQKNERNQQISKNNNSQGNQLQNNIELNYSSISSSTPGNSKASLTQKLQKASSLKSSEDSCNNSSSYSNTSDQSLGKTQLEEKRSSQCVEMVNLLPPSSTAPCPSAYIPHVRFSTYLKQHQEDQSSTPRIISSQAQQENIQNGKESEVVEKSDKIDSKHRDSDQEFFTSIQQRNHPILPMREEVAGNKASKIKTKSQATLFSIFLAEVSSKPETKVDVLVRKENPLEYLRENISNQENRNDNTSNQFKKLLNPTLGHQSPCKSELLPLSNLATQNIKGSYLSQISANSQLHLSSSQIPSIYESTQKLMNDLKIDECIIPLTKNEDKSNENQAIKDIIWSERNDLLLNSEEPDCSNSQTILAECTQEKRTTTVELDNSNANKNEEDSFQGYKMCSLPPKILKSAIANADKGQQQQSQQQQGSSSQQKQDNNSSQKKKVKISLELASEEDIFINKSESNSKKESKTFAFDQPKNVRRNLSSEMISEYDQKQSSSLQTVTHLQKKDDQSHLLRKETNLEQDIQVNNADAFSQSLLSSSESSSLLNIPQCETGPSFSKSQSHPLLLQNNHQSEADTPPCEITISISNKYSSMNQSKTILKNSFIESSYSSLTRLNAGNSVKKSQRRISFKDNIETVNIFEPEQKNLLSRSPNSKILLPRLKSRQEFKKEPYFNPIKKFPGIHGNPTFLQQYSNSESSSLDVSLLDDKSPSKSNTSLVFEITPRNNIHHIRNNSSQQQLDKNDFKIASLNTLHNITPTKQALFKPLNFTPSGGCSGKSSKQTKLSFLEYSKIAKQQDQKQ